ncbi:UNVERIFIED_CONTAM: hypothetical protein HDU68_004271 [Siphonaria sp. JEL0065]|nr:hypothetical protein HDU68_004271 [Siphonaria sp. JEL0065]
MPTSSLTPILEETRLQLSTASNQFQFDQIQKTIANAIDDLKDLALEYDDPNSKEAQQIHDLEGCFIETALRKAKLDHKQTQDSLKQNERLELLKSSRKDDRKSLEKVEQAKLAGKELTDSMREAARMMQAEVDKSVAAVQALESSTQMLEKTRTQYTVYESVLSLSTNLLKEIHRGSIMDKLILCGGLGFFVLVVLYIVFKRTWIPGLSLVFPKKKAVVETVKTISTAMVSTATSIAKNAATTASSDHHDQHHHRSHFHVGRDEL